MNEIRYDVVVCGVCGGIDVEVDCKWRPNDYETTLDSVDYGDSRKCWCFTCGCSVVLVAKQYETHWSKILVGDYFVSKDITDKVISIWDTGDDDDLAQDDYWRLMPVSAASEKKD